jgi:hypothetical protein
MICFSTEKMREPRPRSHRLLLRPVHGGLVTGTGRRTRRRMARGRYKGRELTTEALRERGEPHRNVGGRRGGAVWPGDGETKRRRTKLGGSAIRVGMERADARNGKMVWRRCSRAAFIGWGQWKGGGRGVIRRWLGGA